MRLRPVTFVLSLLCVCALLGALPAQAQAQTGGQTTASEEPSAQTQASDPAAQTQPADPAEKQAQPDGDTARETQPAPKTKAPPLSNRPHDADLSSEMTAAIETLDKVEATLTRENLDAATLDKLRQDVEQAGGELTALIQKVRPQLELLRNQLEKLGEAPGEGQPPEPEAIAGERASLQSQVNNLDATVKAAEAQRVRANQLSDRIQSRRRALFTSQLFERTTTPLSLSLWQDAIAQVETGWRRFTLLLADSTRNIESNRPLYGILGAVLAVWLLLQVACWYGVNHFREWDETEPPPFWQRAASGAWVIVLRALPVIAAAATFYAMLKGWNLLSPRAEQIARALAVALITVAVVSALSTTILAPNRPMWRILPVADHSAKQVNWLIFALAAVFGIDKVLNTINDVLYMPLSTTITQSSATNVIFAVLLTAILMTRLRADQEPREEDVDWLHWLRAPGYLLTFAILAATAIGYVAFARFLATQIVVTGSILIVVFLMLVWANAVTDRIRSAESGQGRLPPLPSDTRRREQIALFLGLLLKAAVFLVAFPFILLQWGFDWQDLTVWTQKVFFGFQVGGLTISLATVLGAVAVFIVAYAIARVLLSWLDSQVMEPAGLSGGVRDSVRTGLGYVGFIAAALIAVSYAGVDFSNLAIVAGALSVGIGFGLQSIVNNFVSGLILLAERPIKVGDWVVVGQDQGFVRKISVRATEIETFDRANVVVPNSMLISDKVQNWTLHNNVGRIKINVGVSYASDPEGVRDILLKVAREHPQILTHPEPYVWFSDFGNSSLDFTLFCYALNITRQLGIQTDLRIAIVKKFREEGIEIPYPQSDVHLRDLNWLKTAMAEQLARIREENAGGDNADGGKHFPDLPGAGPSSAKT